MISLKLPIENDQPLDFPVGQEILLNGTMLVGRDQVHLRLFEALQNSESLPIPIRNQAIYYMGPAPTPPGEVIGSAGPTTAYRMDPFTPLLLDQGLKIMIGKGPRSEEVRQAVKRNSGAYLYAYGGCGALYAQAIKSQRPVAFEDLGPEALIEIRIENFPVVMAINSKGDSIYPSR